MRDGTVLLQHCTDDPSWSHSDASLPGLVHRDIAKRDTYPVSDDPLDFSKKAGRADPQAEAKLSVHAYSRLQRIFSGLNLCEKPGMVAWHSW
jgi:hypothetical protein